MLNNYPIESYTPERIQETYLIIHPNVLERYHITLWEFHGVFERGSNFSHLKYPIEDKHWNIYEDSEWYYMSLRFDDLDVKKKIAAASKIKNTSKRVAYRYKKIMNMNNDDRIEFMRDTIQKKYDNSEWRREMLIKTWEREIIEFTYWWDEFFWISHDKRQWRNVLGKLHMEYRDNL